MHVARRSDRSSRLSPRCFAPSRLIRFVLMDMGGGILVGIGLPIQKQRAAWRERGKCQEVEKKAGTYGGGAGRAEGSPLAHAITSARGSVKVNLGATRFVSGGGRFQLKRHAQRIFCVFDMEWRTRIRRAQPCSRRWPWSTGGRVRERWEGWACRSRWWHSRRPRT